MKTMKDTENFLKTREISPSYQRMKIYNLLSNTKSHPTVGGIYKNLKSDIPSLSKTTVYNTLNMFVENNIVSALTIEDKEVRYDADTFLHGHFKCIKCGKVTDIEIDSNIFNESFLNSYDVNEYHLNFKGTCQNCINNLN